MKALLDAGLLHGDCLTVTGKTMAENLAELDPPAARRRRHPPAVGRSTQVGGLTILKGSLAPRARS
jgi:dihydroxy-acid dehydratase